MSRSSNITLRRLVSQGLYKPRFKTPEEAVGWLGAIQGQDYYGAKWSVGLRVPGSTDATIEQALSEHRLVRTWALRGTLHFVAASDVRWLVPLVAPRIVAGNTRRYRELGLEEETLARINDILLNAVSGGQGLDRRVLFAHLEQNGISPEGQRGVYMLQRASLDGLICQGPAPRNNPLFFALDECVRPGRTMAHEEALAELATRYWMSRGPATLDDFVWWSGLPTSEARTALKAIQSSVVEDDIESKSYWCFSSSLSPRPPRISCSLLPGFDEYLLGYRDRSASLDVPHYNRLTPTNGMPPPTIVLGGKVLGTWKRTLNKDTVTIALNPFHKLDDSEKDLIAIAAKRYGQFLDLKAQVEV